MALVLETHNATPRHKGAWARGNPARPPPTHCLPGFCLSACRLLPAGAGLPVAPRPARTEQKTMAPNCRCHGAGEATSARHCRLFAAIVCWSPPLTRQLQIEPFLPSNSATSSFHTLVTHTLFSSRAS